MRGVPRSETTALFARRLRPPSFDPPLIEAVDQVANGLPTRANSLAHHARFAAIAKTNDVRAELAQLTVNEFSYTLSASHRETGLIIRPPRSPTHRLRGERVLADHPMPRW